MLKCWSFYWQVSRNWCMVFQDAHFYAILDMINQKNHKQSMHICIWSEFRQCFCQHSSWGVREHDRVGDWYLPPELPVSVGVSFPGKSSSVDVHFLSHFTLCTKKFTSWRPVCSGIYLSVSLWTWATNGNIPQQPSPWQQDETCCAAYFLSANLQLPSKPLPFRQTGPLHLISFTSFPHLSASHRFLLMWHSVSHSVFCSRLQPFV